MSKEHEIKTKMEWEQWLQLKMMFLFCCNLKVVIWGGEGGGGEGFLGEGWRDGMSKFSAGGGTPPILRSRENPVRC